MSILVGLSNIIQSISEMHNIDSLPIICSNLYEIHKK